MSKEVNCVSRKRAFVVGSLIMGNHSDSCEEAFGKGQMQAMGV